MIALFCLISFKIDEVDNQIKIKSDLPYLLNRSQLMLQKKQRSKTFIRKVV